ncbi:MAG: hypothetical protein FJW37_05630 [Acidobacteria bacterium]|nr:hypothetical protein [Acidobacteriota bacterium]
MAAAERQTAELEEAATHVCYELNMLRYCLQWYLREGDCFGPGNAAQECFLLHFRNLRDFFFGEGKHQDDVLAKHFVDNNWIPSKPQCFIDTYDIINKCLAHISYERRNLKPDWRYEKYEEFARNIERLMEELRANLSEVRKAWFVFR